MFDLVALGELLIDFTPSGFSATGCRLFEQNPGGAPANVLAAVAKLGKKGAFIGMVGSDQFGVFLKEVLQSNNIDTRGLKVSPTVNTTLAFVHLDRDGDRSFSFYRNPGADQMLTVADLDYDLLQQARIFHFGSLSMTAEPSRSATLAAVKFAKQNNAIISYDPNYRPQLWPDEEQARKQMKTGLEYADIVKVSEAELELLTGTGDLLQGSALLHEMGIGVVLVTLGPAGCFYRYHGGSGRVAGFNVQAIDTTGAGDAFLAGILSRFSDLSLGAIKALAPGEFQKTVRFANALGALTTTKKGAIPALPQPEEIERLLKEG
jgi:fructokinase